MLKLVTLIALVCLVAHASADGDAWLTFNGYDDDCKVLTRYSIDFGQCTSAGNGGSVAFSCIDDDQVKVLSWNNNDCSGDPQVEDGEPFGFPTSCIKGNGVQVTLTCKTSKSVAKHVLGTIYVGSDSCDGEVYGQYSSDVYDCSNLPDSQKGCQSYPIAFSGTQEAGSVSVCGKGSGGNGGNGGSGSSDATVLFSSMTLLLASLAVFFA